MTISESESLRAVYGQHAAKKIARDFGVAIVTAKVWLAGRFPAARNEELRRRIIAELDRRDAQSAALRRQWSGEISAEVDRAEDRGLAVGARAEADGLGGEMNR